MTRQSSEVVRNIIPLDEKTARKIMETATTCAAADYLCERNRDPAFAAIFAEFRDNTYLQHKRDDPWSGNAKIMDDFQNLQNNLAARAVARILEHANNIQVDLAIDDEAKLLRGYAVDGKPLGTDVVNNLDTLLNGFLANSEPMVITQDSFLYQTDTNGNVILKNGEPTKPLPDKVREAINLGLGKYCDNLGLDVEVSQYILSAAKTAPAAEEIEALAEELEAAKVVAPAKVRGKAKAPKQKQVESIKPTHPDGTEEPKKSKGTKKP